jgi:CheY-like chemotaxis protein
MENMAKILIVDDDPDFVEIVRTILLKSGYEVATASNGEEAWESIQKNRPAVVLLDVMMSTILDGVDLAHRIGADPALGSVRVVMVTSIMDTQSAGLFPTDEYIPAQVWLTKPVQPQILLTTVAKVLGAPASA